MDSMTRLLYWLLEGTKGGPTRIRILSLLLKKPMNLRQLSLAAELDYKTVEHHVQLLTQNSVIECQGNGYGRVYFVSEEMLTQKEIMGLLRGGRNGGKKKS